MTTAITRKIDISGNLLKYIAILAMFFDHFVSVFVCQPDITGSLLRVPGRLTAPIMCYLIAEGFYYTSNLRRYTKRLFLFALISHFPYVWYFNLPWWRATSVMWSLTLGLLALAIVKRGSGPLWSKPICVGVCCLLAYTADWNFIAVLWILFFGLYRGDFKSRCSASALLDFSYIFFRQYCVQGFCPPMHLVSFWLFHSFFFITEDKGEKVNFLNGDFTSFIPFIYCCSIFFDSGFYKRRIRIT